MPEGLRTRMIRLAYSRPEIRPHLLPLLASANWKKEAWLRIPEDFVDFGFRGPGAEAAGLQLAKSVQDAVGQLRIQARKSWKSLGDELLSLEGVDAHPKLARTAVYSALADTYKDLAARAEQYFVSLP